MGQGLTKEGICSQADIWDHIFPNLKGRAVENLNNKEAQWQSMSDWEPEQNSGSRLGLRRENCSSGKGRVLANTLGFLSACHLIGNRLAFLKLKVMFESLQSQPGLGYLSLPLLLARSKTKSYPEEENITQGVRSAVHWFLVFVFLDTVSGI